MEAELAVILRVVFVEVFEQRCRREVGAEDGIANLLETKDAKEDLQHARFARPH
jgi:hypothetical protein